MYSVLLTIHVIVTVLLIGIILKQRSASDGMGLSGSSSSSFLSGRAASSFTTTATSVLAALFILTSLALGIITARSHPGESSILDKLDSGKPAASAPASPATPSAPATAPTQPSVPRPQ